jgi:phage repressor protein C with HTH and peptisase S24 domain
MFRVAELYMYEFMIEKHERLRQARIDAGFSTASAAANALSLAASTYRAHENGQNSFDLEEAQFYAKKFAVDAIWLLTGKATPGINDVAKSDSGKAMFELPNATIGDKVEGLGRKIPVYGQAVGGVDGEFLMNGTILYEVMAPPVISHISGAYGVSVSGDSMSPRYEDGEVCFVDPKRRVKRGDYVIAQIRQEEHGPLLAYVKRFVRQNSIELELEQFNPPKELRFAGNSVHTVHYIALAGNA